jgi:hypothetical protein
VSKADSHSEGLLGIHLSTTQGRAQGSPPSDEELALLMDAQLSKERRSEVLSHLAHRPERYRQWLSLADMDADEQESHASLLNILSKAINNWLIDWRYAAGGVAAMAAFLLVVNQMSTSGPQKIAELEQIASGYAAAPKRADEAITAQSLMAAKPSVDATGRQQNLEREMAGERSGIGGVASAKRLAATPLKANCLAAINPLTDQPGALCAAQTADDAYELRWTSTNSSEALPLIALPQWPLQLLVSKNNRWLATQRPEAIDVFELPAAFTGNNRRSQLAFTAETARMRWDGNTLLISVLQALGDSDDDLVYRYQPETGDMQAPSP